MNPSRIRTSLQRRLLTCLAVILLSGCSILGGKKEPTTIYVTNPQPAVDAAWPSVSWQLTLSRPEASRSVDTLRIAVRPVPYEMQYYKDAAWAKLPSDQIQDALQRTLEASQRLPAVARQGSGIAADYKLVMDIRRFDSDYAGGATPSAVVEVGASLLHAPTNSVVESRVFRQSVPATATDVPSVVHAFEQALNQLGHELGGWVLTSGHAHRPGKR
ncbi:MAG: ABC transporter [Pseudoxanthomonas suwonensis]|nr:MAG: ABC transporter [Pseudoxanthomonas suwonensis]